MYWLSKRAIVWKRPKTNEIMLVKSDLVGYFFGTMVRESRTFRFTATSTCKALPFHSTNL